MISFFYERLRNVLKNFGLIFPQKIATIKGLKLGLFLIKPKIGQSCNLELLKSGIPSMLKLISISLVKLLKTCFQRAFLFQNNTSGQFLNWSLK